MKSLHILSIVFFLSASIPAFAEDDEIYSHKRHGAVKGVDVVAFFDLPEGAKAIKGSDDYVYEWKGATWKFSNEENRRRFSRDPDHYAPQYGGYCAFAVAHGFTTSPRPDNWKIVDGKLYLNNNSRSFERWLADHENKIAEADKNWPKVLKK